MRPLNIYTCLMFGASILLIIINIRTQLPRNPYYLTSIKNGKSVRFFLKIEDEEESYTLQIPIVLNDGTHGPTEIPTNVQNKTHSLIAIKHILVKARTEIKYDLTNFNFSQSDVDVLEDLVMESGGQPLRSLIISSWRSGSTFLGDLVNSIPSTYYHYEPLLMYGIKQIREARKASKALRMIKQMFKCNFYGLEDYFKFESKDLSLKEFNHNTRLFNYCKDKNNNNELCFNEEYTSRFCRLFPFQNMKLVRLRLRLVEQILNDKELNVKVILLVRDPRGMMQSRRHRHFCVTSPDCFEPSLVCNDLVSDYVAAGHILQKYPGRLLVVRFEDLVLKPYITTDRILKFLKRDGRKAFDEFLQSHTTAEVDGPHSTIKVSRNVPFKWKTALNFSYINDIQKACKQAMHLWGYKMAENETHLMSKDFNPIENYMIL